jgi:hypothetical protein
MCGDYERFLVNVNDLFVKLQLAFFNQKTIRILILDNVKARFWVTFNYGSSKIKIKSCPGLGGSENRISNVEFHDDRWLVLLTGTL